MEECAKLHVSRAFLPHVPHVPACLCLSAFLFLRALFFLRALRALTFLHALRALCAIFLTCLKCLHFLSDFRVFTFLSVSNFWRALFVFTFYIKYGTTHNQPQKSEITKREVE